MNQQCPVVSLGDHGRISRGFRTNVPHTGSLRVQILDRCHPLSTTTFSKVRMASLNVHCSVRSSW